MRQEYPRSPYPFVTVIPATEQESPLHCYFITDEKKTQIFGNKCSIILHDLSVVYNR